MKKILAAALLLITLGAQAQPIYWEPGLPARHQSITIYTTGFQPGDMLHWAVTVNGEAWKRPISAYHPQGSSLYGAAIRTPIEPLPDQPTVGHVTLGPFNNPQQRINAIVFAISRPNGSWDNNQGEDYSIPVTAGRIRISPEQPTANEIITVTVFDSAPDTYLRWGVNAERNQWEPVHPVYHPESTQWADDAVGADTLLPPPNAEGHAVLQIGPFNRGEQLVRSLHMAVHWKGVWDTDSGRNYNFPLDWESPPATLELVHPATGTSAHDAVSIEVRNPMDAAVELWLNGELLTTLTEAPYTYELSLDDQEMGPHRLTVRSETESAVLLDSVVFWRVPEMESLPMPAGTEYGATLHQDNRVTFALYAPGKQFIELVLYSDTETIQYPMHIASDGSWWLTLELEPGRYRYQYLIESDLLLADPYARQVDWTNPAGQKGWLPRDTFSVIEVGAEPYVWESTFTRPDLDELVIYELYIEDFAPREGFEGIVRRLDYIADLGVNAIEPLPWHPWTGMESWGYNPAYHFAVEQLYGTPHQLKRLIDESHKRGMAVIIDMVLNHAEWNSSLYQLYGNDYDASPYFRAHTGHNWGFPKIDQQSLAVKRWTADVIRFWIREYRIDGFRYDATRWTGWQGYNDWGASWYAYVARQEDPTNYQIAEHLPIEPPLITDTEMDTGWHAEYRWRIREMITRAHLNVDGFKEAMNARRVGFTHPRQRLPYTESHDEERVVRELREAGFVEDEVFRRAAMAIALTLTTPGVPMIFAGQEFGEDTAKRVGWNPLNWSLLNQEPNRRLHSQTRDLIKLRTQHPALRGDNLRFVVTDAASGLAIFERDSSPHVVHVAANFGRQPVEASIQLQGPAQWREVLAGKDQEPGHHEITLLPGEIKVWATQRD
jgi:1,4-alpha-glucan branching enzyme